MSENTVISLLDECEPFDDCGVESAEVIKADIDLVGTTISLRIGVREGPARLSDIVPLARMISDKFTSIFRDNLAKNNRSVSCHKGCCACCSYLVALSFPEIFRLQEELTIMAARDGISFLQSCLDSAKKILDMYSNEKHKLNECAEIDQISRWYSELHLPCPFLSNGLCSIYEQRPLACREHMVTSPPALCKSSTTNFPKVVDMPVSVLEVLGQLAAEFEQSETEAVILPLAFTCAEDYLDRSRRTWSAISLVERFVDILETTAAKHITEPELSV
jgi:Fe-S-cluster containining protein